MTCRLTKKNFDFNRVFSSTSTNLEMYREVFSIIQVALKKSNIIIVIDNQNDIDKSHIMFTSEHVIASFVTKQIFDWVSLIIAQDWECTMKMFCFEIYLRKLWNLLLKESKKRNYRQEISYNVSKIFNYIKKISSIRNLLNTLYDVNEDRQYNKSNSNSNSSRNMFVTILIFSRKKMSANKTIKTSRLYMLNLVDDETRDDSISNALRIAKDQAINQCRSTFSINLIAWIEETYLKFLARSNFVCSTLSVFLQLDC